MRGIYIGEITNEPAIVEQDSSKQPESARLNTGIDILDRNLNGGIPSGTMVYFEADPKSVPDVFLYELTMPRKTFYVTTEKNRKYLLRNMDELLFDTAGVDFVDLHEEYYERIVPSVKDRQEAQKKVIKCIDDWLDGVRKQDTKNFTIIFDTFTFFVELGVDMDTMKRIFDKIYELVNDTDSICFLFMIKGLHEVSLENRLQYWCDVVFRVDLELKGDKMINKLAIPKIRGMTPLTEYIKFKVTDRITIDTSRDIA